MQAIGARSRAFDIAAQPKRYREDLIGEGTRQAVKVGLINRKEIYVSLSSFTSSCFWNKRFIQRPSNKPSTAQLQGKVQRTVHTTLNLASEHKLSLLLGLSFITYSTPL